MAYYVEGVPSSAADEINRLKGFIEFNMFQHEGHMKIEKFKELLNSNFDLYWGIKKNGVEFVMNHIIQLFQGRLHVDDQEVLLTRKNQLKIVQHTPENNYQAPDRRISNHLNNVLVYGLPESSAPDLSSQTAEDKETLIRIFSNLVQDPPTEFKHYRLISFHYKDPSPIKVEFVNANIASEVYFAFSLAKSNSSWNLPHIQILQDNFLVRKQRSACLYETAPVNKLEKPTFASIV